MAEQGGTMREPARGTSRREFLKAAGWGAAGAVTAGGLVTGFGSRLLVPSAKATTTTLSLVASDGYANVPGRPGNP